MMAENAKPEELVEKVYQEELQTIIDRALWGLSSLVEVEKELVAPVSQALKKLAGQRSGPRKTQLKLVGHQLVVSDPTYTSTLIEFEKAVSQCDQSIYLLPHLDLMTVADNGLTGVTKLFMQILSSYPETPVIGFFDPNLSCHRSLRDFFPSQVRIFGIKRRDIAAHLLKKNEKEFLEKCGLPPMSLYKHCSGLNAVKFRRIIEFLMQNRGCLPEGPQAADWILERIQEFTLSEGFEIPNISLDGDIGGYPEVKSLLKENILEVMKLMDQQEKPEAFQEIENLIPRGIILHGPPGTGKTLFAKALASELQASVQVISGPEIKSRWFGESEERLRKIFFQARKNAPSVVVFDELDAIAPRRGLYEGGSGAEHSIVNQLLTELDGFRPENLVFFVGTTNLLESIDPALLRPGRVELKLHIDYPDAAARAGILEIYNRKFTLELDDALKEYIIDRSGDCLDRRQKTRFTGDHIESLARFLKRTQLKSGRPASRADVDAGLGINSRRISLAAGEEEVVALHEAGHALLISELLPDSEVRKISIIAESQFNLGFTEATLKETRYQFNREDLERQATVLLGGRAAEKAHLKTLSMGASADIELATMIARAMVETYGFSPLGPVDLSNKELLSEDLKQKSDQAVLAILGRIEAEADRLIRARLDTLLSIRDQLIKKKTLNREEFLEVLDGQSQH